MVFVNQQQSWHEEQVPSTALGNWYLTAQIIDKLFKHKLLSSAPSFLNTLGGEFLLRKSVCLHHKIKDQSLLCSSGPLPYGAWLESSNSFKTFNN